MVKIIVRQLCDECNGAKYINPNDSMGYCRSCNGRGYKNRLSFYDRAGVKLPYYIEP